ncbi:MAG: VWA domain-containing protein [Acidobacteriaceae bacterium]|nr:VWA domain-containing protein [Acidobacteriaceae bacterium]
MRCSRAGIVLALSLPALLSTRAAAQSDAPEMATQESAPTFKSGVNLVLVPVVVRDGQGRALGNLKKEDFRLFDKGKPQAISRFSVETSGGNPSAASTSSPATSGDASPEVTPAAMPKRYVAYLFDDLHAQFGDLVRLQKAAVKHLSIALQPSDRAAIYVSSGQGNVDFTDDLAKLKDAVMKLRPHPLFVQAANDCPYMTYYMADQIVNKNDQSLLQTLAQDTIVCANLQGTGAQQQAQAMVQSAAQSFLPMGEQDTRVTLGFLKGVIRRISAMPGQRTVILVSPGFMTITPESFQDKNDLLDRAARGNVMISSLDARGLYTDSTFDVSERGSATSQLSIRKAEYARQSDTMQADILAELAEGTGGTFFQNNNDFDAAFQRLAAAPQYLYLLGFSPQNLKMDGAYHKLKITLADSKGVTIQARRGYYAPKHAQSEEETAKAELQGAVFSREEMHDIPIDLHTQFFKPDPADAKLTVLARVDLKRIRFKKLEGRNRNDLTLVAALFDQNGNYLVANKKVIEMRLRDETLARLNSGITIRTSFDVKPGTYLVRLVVRDTEGQMMSAKNGAVDIP